MEYYFQEANTLTLLYMEQNRFGGAGQEDRVQEHRYGSLMAWGQEASLSPVLCPQNLAPESRAPEKVSGTV
jgi:hypothetical protein